MKAYGAAPGASWTSCSKPSLDWAHNRSHVFTKATVRATLRQMKKRARQEARRDLREQIGAAP